MIKKLVSTKSFKKLSNKLPSRLKNKRLVVPFVTIVFLSLVIFAYGLVNFYFSKDKTYSNLYLGNVAVGGKSSEELTGSVNKLLNKTQLEFNYKEKSEKITATQVGLFADNDSLNSKVDDKSFWGAFRPWFIKKHEEMPLKLNSEKLDKTLMKFKKNSFKAPKDATFYVKNEKLVIKPEKNGYGLDVNLIGTEIVETLSSGFGNLSKQLETSTILPEITQSDIEMLSSNIKTRLNSQYRVQARGSVITAAKKDIVNWLRVTKNESKVAELKTNPDAIKKYVKTIAKSHSIAPVNEVTSQYKSGKKSAITTVGKDGLGVTNLDSVADDLVKKIDSGQSYSGKLTYSKIAFQRVTKVVDDTIKLATYTYDVAVWGNVSSNLSTFKTQAAETLADPRGWSAGGVTFQQVSSGGDFTLVLAEPARVASVAPICSADWSCRTGRFVIINDARWSGATTAWNNAGGGLRDYRHMVVNHESGHWLGFSHRYCLGSGKLAPVMQQQSISLQGCKFNPWPTAAEINSL